LTTYRCAGWCHGWGGSFPEIAGGLFVSPHTIKTQALAIDHKLGVSCRTAAVDRARALGLLPEPAGVARG